MPRSRSSPAGRWRVGVAGLLAACVATGCTGSAPAPDTSSAATHDTPASPRPALPSVSRPVPPLRRHLPARPRILFLGNSHTHLHDVPGTVAALLRAGRPRLDARVAVAPGLLHLDERASDEATVRLLQARSWDVVVLQAQNYSLSGVTDYPSDGSVALVRAARAQGALPVLFAEWPRRGIDETQIILRAYREIARREPACLPPVPETFDHAKERGPPLRLLAADGNHSSAAGAFLASLVLAATISGQDVAALPRLGSAGVPARVQRRLRALAAEELERIPATRGCPGSGPAPARR